MAKQTKITKSARGEDCTLLLGNCSGSDTVVLCHIGKNRGMSYKCGDHMAVYGCGNCHKIIDGQVHADFTRGELAEIKLIALERTQQKLIDKGLLVIS
ncbi:MAG: hypothetical protein COA43_14690 [Robiginitomaculum sp.]|nr:MAG: hypothetical protein COA43_14690 [Robiginitomaculum sp.]